jgi:hypothetical protein
LNEKEGNFGDLDKIEEHLLSLQPIKETENQELTYIDKEILDKLRLRSLSMIKSPQPEEVVNEGVNEGANEGVNEGANDGIKRLVYNGRNG